MEYRRFGRTEIAMPIFSCGGVRFIYDEFKEYPQEQIPLDHQKNAEATIYRSLEVGINHLETARIYGTSEMQLGSILSSLERQNLIIQTKIMPQSEPKHFRKLFEQSLSYLGLNYVDLLTVHGINHEQQFKDTLRPQGCLDIIKQLQLEGKVRFRGFSTHAPSDLIIKTIETDQFDYVNLHWYYINQFNWPAIETAYRYDLGVFIISPSDKGGMLYKPPQKLVNLCSPLSPMLFNDLFCLSRPQIHTLSLGAAKPSDFDEHLQVIKLLDQADQILPPILERLENEAIACLGEDWFKNWYVGLPSYQETPGEINIPIILWLRNLAIAYDLFEYAQRRYNHLKTQDPWFPGNPAENLDQFDLKPCLKNSPYQDIIPTILKETHQLLNYDVTSTYRV